MVEKEKDKKKLKAKNTTEEIKEKINIIFSTFEELRVLNREAKAELSNIDKELSNQYHIIEGYDLFHMVDSHLLILKLRDILFRRRNAKLNQTLLESIVASLDSNTTKSKKKYHQLMAKHAEIIQEIIDRAK